MNGKKILCGSLAVCMIALSGCAAREQSSDKNNNHESVSSEISLASSKGQKASSETSISAPVEPKKSFTQENTKSITPSNNENSLSKDQESSLEVSTSTTEIPKDALRSCIHKRKRQW